MSSTSGRLAMLIGPSHVTESCGVTVDRSPPSAALVGMPLGMTTVAAPRLARNGQVLTSALPPSVDAPAPPASPDAPAAASPDAPAAASPPPLPERPPPPPAEPVTHPPGEHLPA